MRAGGELPVWLRLGAQDVRPVIFLLEAGGARGGQQDELCEAVEVRHTAESLYQEHHGDQAQEEVDCRDGREAMSGPRPPRSWPWGYGIPQDGAATLSAPSLWDGARPPSHQPSVPRQPPHSPVTNNL